MKTIVLSGDSNHELHFSNEAALLQYESFSGQVDIVLSGKARLYEVSATACSAKRNIFISGNSEITSVLHNGHFDLNISLSDKASCFTRAAFLSENNETTYNYHAKHIGKESKSNLYLYSLIRNARKSSDLKIDFISGATDSEATEKEIAILLDNSAQNKSIPAIYCGEENIHGSHALSCGHISEDELTYLRARGFTDEQIRELLIQSNIRYITSRIKSKTVLKYIQEIVKKYV